MSLLASPSAEQVLARTAEWWDLSGPLPMPRGEWLRCPVCGDGDVQLRHWVFHERPKPHTLPYRCDVRLKCRRCAALWAHGVALPVDYWRHNARRPRAKIGRREGARLLEAS